jgi:hypothetical protein
MNRMKVFIEEQKFKPLLVIVVLAITFIVVLLSITSNWDYIITTNLLGKISAFSGLVVVILVAFLFANLKLKTRIDENGIYYQYFPFHFSYKLIKWTAISKCYTRNYNAISEFCGWGIKFSFKKDVGKSFTTKGNIGLQIELKNGNKILIGTQQKDEIQQVINTYKLKVATNET